MKNPELENPKNLDFLLDSGEGVRNTDRANVQYRSHGQHGKELRMDGTVTTGVNRLVLGFDGGCMTCSALAHRIEEQVGDKLEVRGLHEPQVQQWRKEAMGENAPWAPTLIEVNGGKAKAWTGPKMGLRLSRALGPIATWRVMQVMGDLNTAKKANSSPSDENGSSMSRGYFLKGAGGAALGASLLLGVSSVASTAGARNGAAESASTRETSPLNPRRMARASLAGG